MALEDVAAVGSLILFFVASLRTTSARQNVSIGLLVFGASFAVGAVLVTLAMTATRFAPPTPPSALRKDVLTALKNPREKNVLIVEGGSYAAHGVDPMVLRRALVERGYSVRVVMLTLTAGNHLERRKLHQDLMHDLGALRARKRGQRWIYLSEICFVYDENPFAQLDKNIDTVRAFHYLTPANAVHGLRSVLLAGGRTPEFSRFHLAWTVTRHALVNATNTGLASMLVPWSEIRPRSGYMGGAIEKGFRFAGLNAVLAATDATLDGVVIPEWNFSVRERLARELWSSHVDRWAYFGIPSTRANQMLHARRFCSVTRYPCIVPTDRSLLHALDDASDWYNAGHLSSKGARTYSRWLAEALDEQRLLVK